MKELQTIPFFSVSLECVVTVLIEANALTKECRILMILIFSGVWCIGQHSLVVYIVWFLERFGDCPGLRAARLSQTTSVTSVTSVRASTLPWKGTGWGEEMMVVINGHIQSIIKLIITVKRHLMAPKAWIWSHILYGRMVFLRVDRVMCLREKPWYLCKILKDGCTTKGSSPGALYHKPVQ